jgi:hypothetical protein
MVPAVPPIARVPRAPGCHILGIMQNRPSHAYAMALDGILHGERRFDDDPLAEPVAADDRPDPTDPGPPPPGAPS